MNLAGVLSILTVLGVSSAPSGGQEPEGTNAVRTVSIKEAAIAPEKLEGNTIQLEGKLENVGKSYFKGMRLVLKDGEDAVRVLPWLPLETAPARATQESPRHELMSSYLSRKVRLAGALVKNAEGDWVFKVSKAEILTD